MITRMQIALRDGVGSRRSETDQWYSSRPHDAKADGRHVFMAWALVEARPGAFEPERCYRLSHAVTRTGFCLDVSRSPEDLSDKPYGDEVAPDAEVSDAVREMEVASPKDPFAYLVWPGFGKLLLRRTNFPVADGREAFVASGILVGPRDTPTETLLTLSSVGNGLVETDRREVPGAFRMGQAASAPLRHPMWGFEGEPRGFCSTMRQDAIDACSRYRTLETADRDAEAEAEFRALEDHRAVRSVLGGSRRDDQFADFLRFVRESGRDGERSRRLDGFPTAAEIERQELAMGDLLREWMEADRPSARYR